MIGKILEQMPFLSLVILLNALYIVDLYVVSVTKKGANYPNKSNDGFIYKHLGWIKSSKVYFVLICLYTAFSQLIFVITLSYIGRICGFKLVLPSKMCWLLITIFSSVIALICCFKILMKGIPKHIVIDDGIPKHEPYPKNEVEKISHLRAFAFLIYGLCLGAMDDDKRKVVILSIIIGTVALFLCSFPTLVNILAIATNRNFP